MPVTTRAMARRLAPPPEEAVTPPPPKVKRRGQRGVPTAPALLSPRSCLSQRGPVTRALGRKLALYRAQTAVHLEPASPAPTPLHLEFISPAAPPSPGVLQRSSPPIQPRFGTQTHRASIILVTGSRSGSGSSSRRLTACLSAGPGTPSFWHARPRHMSAYFMKHVIEAVEKAQEAHQKSKYFQRKWAGTLVESKPKPKKRRLKLPPLLAIDDAQLSVVAYPPGGPAPPAFRGSRMWDKDVSFKTDAAAWGPLLNSTLLTKQPSIFVESYMRNSGVEGSGIGTEGPRHLSFGISAVLDGTAVLFRSFLDRTFRAVIGIKDRLRGRGGRGAAVVQDGDNMEVFHTLRLR